MAQARGIQYRKGNSPNLLETAINFIGALSSALAMHSMQSRSSGTAAADAATGLNDPPQPLAIASPV